MKYIKKLSLIAVAAVVLVSGFAVVAEKNDEGAFKPEKIFAHGKREFKKFDKKNFKRPEMKKVELTEEEKAAKLEEMKQEILLLSQLSLLFTKLFYIIFHLCRNVN